MVTFNFTYDPGVTVQQALGFEIAGRIWSHYLSDPVTLNLHIGISGSLPTNVIGGALPGIQASTSYTNFRDRLVLDRTSSLDQRVVLGDFLEMDFAVSINNGTQVLHDSVLLNGTTVNLTRAGAKSVGIIPGNSTALDGAIVMGNLANSQFRWNYDYTRSSTPAAGSLDFLSVVLHEIGHVLGFVSGVDKQQLQSNLLSDPNQMSNYLPYLENRVRYATPLDLFRYNNSDSRDMTYGSAGGPKYFRADSSVYSTIHQFATGKNTGFSGDGYQASHWQERATPIGIMDPAIAPQERASISETDLIAFDVIGWNRRTGTAASPFTSSSLTNFQTQAVQSLAQRLSQTTTWVNSNLTASPSTLGGDRTTDVETMIRNSLIYEWGTTGSGTTSTSGRRWMEVFNQMASAQEVYVNFSTVSTVTPPETVAGNEQSAERHQGDRQNPKKNDTEYQAEAIWDNPGSEQTNQDLKDQLSGIDSGSQLIGRDIDSFPNPGQAFPTMASDFLSTNTSTVASIQWSPVATRMSETAVASETSSGVGVGSRQHVSPLFSTGLDMLLGVENNVLVSNSLSMGVMGATLAVTAKPHA